MNREIERRHLPAKKVDDPTLEITTDAKGRVKQFLLLMPTLEILEAKLEVSDADQFGRRTQAIRARVRNPEIGEVFTITIER